MFYIEKPYFGAAYYPESWPAEQVEADIRQMKEAGINTVRIAEFAWSTMEAAEGSYDFTFFHHVVDCLRDAGIAVIMGTPTCTPPAWLSEKYPEILIVDASGKRMSHGARRHACPNNETYRKLCAQIVERMAAEFADDENIIGWQIDNELYHSAPSGRGCCCPVCRGKFTAYLKDKYSTIEALNDSWGLHIWSECYTHFEQIPVPDPMIWHHPSLLTEWMLFQARSYKEFSDRQAEILHGYVHVPVGTDMMPFLGLDYEDMNEKLDILQFNHYRDKDHLWEIAFWSSYLRNVKNKPFWITETAPCWGGGTVCAQLNEPNFCIANTWLPVLLGAEANLYWLWRTHWSGQELMHGSIINSWGRPMHVMGEIREIAEGFRKARGMITETAPVPAKIAMHVSHHADILFSFQPMVQGFQYLSALQNDLFRSLQYGGYRPEVISEGLPLAPYKIIISAFLPCLSRKQLDARMMAWVRDGGTWIVGPMTDIRTYEGAKYKHAPMGMLEEAAGIRAEFTLPGGGKHFSFTFDGEEHFCGSGLIYDALTASEGMHTRIRGSYTEGYLKGYAAVTETSIGDKGGRIIILGTVPEAESFRKMIGRFAAECGIAPVCEHSGNMIVQLRAGSSSENQEAVYLTAVEVENKAGTVTVPFACTDVLTMQPYEQNEEINFAPFTVMVLQKK